MFTDYALIKKETLTNIADSLRVKKGSSDTIDPANFAMEIDAIQGSDEVIARTAIEYKNDALTKIGMYAFAYTPELTSVDCPNVITIGKYGFYYCKKLESVNLPNVMSVDNNAFYGCTSLANVDFSSVETIGDNVFNGCASLENINLPNMTNRIQEVDSTIYTGEVKIIGIKGKCEQAATPSPEYPQEIKSVVIGEIKTFTSESYTESITTLSTPITLNGIGDVADEIDIMHGKIIRRIGKVRISANWNWIQHGISVTGFYTRQSLGQANMSDGTNGMFTHFATGQITVDGRAFFGSDTVQLKYDALTSTSALTTWLAENEVYGYYILATPTEEELPAADREVLNNLTYKSGTYISTDSEVEPIMVTEFEMLSCLFGECANLKVIDFGISMADLGDFHTAPIFINCPELTTIILRSETLCAVTKQHNTSITMIKNCDKLESIYVPDDLVESYKVANYWSDYAHLFKPLSGYIEMN